MLLFIGNIKFESSYKLYDYDIDNNLNIFFYLKMTSQFSEISIEDLIFLLKSFDSVSAQKLYSITGSTKQKLDQFTEIISNHVEYPIAYSIIYSNISKLYDNKKSLEPGTIGSFLWGSLSDNKIHYIGNAKKELASYVSDSNTENNVVCSLIGAGSIPKDVGKFCSVPVIYYDGMTLYPLASKAKEALSSSLFGLTPRTFKTIDSNPVSDKSFRVHRDDAILYLPIYSNNRNGITTISNSNNNSEKIVIPSLTTDMINQLTDYGINDVAVFLYEKSNNNYTIYYSGKYNLNKKKIIEIQLPDNYVRADKYLHAKTATTELVKSSVFGVLIRVAIAIIVFILLIWGANKLSDYVGK
jgi:hypothetical protein